MRCRFLIRLDTFAPFKPRLRTSPEREFVDREVDMRLARVTPDPQVSRSVMSASRRLQSSGSRKKHWATVYRAHRADPKPAFEYSLGGGILWLAQHITSCFNGFCAKPHDARRVRHERNPEDCGDPSLGCGRL
jgi:hypothetical protein